MSIVSAIRDQDAVRYLGIEVDGAIEISPRRSQSDPWRNTPISGRGRRQPPRRRSTMGEGPLLYTWVSRCAGHGPGSRWSDPRASVGCLSRRANNDPRDALESRLAVGLLPGRL